MRYITSILIILLILILSGCGNEYVNSQDKATDNISGSETQKESTDTDDQDDQDAKDNEPLITGAWQDDYVAGAVYGQRYHFYADGHYIFEYSQFDESKRVLSEAGVWSLENGTLTLTENSKTLVEGGEKGEPFFSSEYAIVNGVIKIITIEPPEKENYDGFEIYKDTKIEQGFWTMFIGSQYWKLSDDPNLYLNDTVEDGDLYSA